MTNQMEKNTMTKTAWVLRYYSRNGDSWEGDPRHGFDSFDVAQQEANTIMLWCNTEEYNPYLIIIPVAVEMEENND